MPSSVCKHPTCGTILREPGFCPQHVAQAKPTQADYDKYQRDPWSKRFYNSARWKRTRDTKLAHDPMCQEPGCRSLAVHVHHIKAVRLIRFTMPWLLFAAENLWSVCLPCHNRLEKSANNQGPSTFMNSKFH